MAAAKRVKKITDLIKQIKEEDDLSVLEGMLEIMLRGSDEDEDDD